MKTLFSRGRKSSSFNLFTKVKDVPLFLSVVKAQIGQDVKKAAEILSKGGLVAIPTETVYGLAANGLNPNAVLKIFEAKNRPNFDPLIVHIGDASEVNNLALSFPAVAQPICQKFWPGPLTIVLPKKEIVPDLVTSGLPSVGIRMPSHTITLELLEILPFPLAAPSANPFGYISPTTAEHVADQLGDKVDYILDGGPSSVGVESTIISFENKIPQILRWGGLEIEKIEPFLDVFESSHQSSDNPSAPGMLSSHYAPSTKLMLGDMENLLEKFGKNHCCCLSFQKNYGPGEVLSHSGDLREAAKNLFAAMRRLDQEKCEFILAELVPDKGLGKAINDRLRRAAHEL